MFGDIRGHSPRRAFGRQQSYDLARKNRPRNGVTGVERTKPDVEALLDILNEHGVEYVVTGSAAALLHGAALEPGDLDITPALDHGNLDRLRRVLEAIHAHQYEDAGFGHWETNDAGEHRWVTDQATPENVAARANWSPNPHDPATYDYLLASDFGSIDIVPVISGTYEQLAPRAATVLRAGHWVLVEAVSDLLATLTVPRREKDAGRVRQLRHIQRRQESAGGR
jgi:hypothetical protein